MTVWRHSYACWSYAWQFFFSIWLVEFSRGIRKTYYRCVVNAHKDYSMNGYTMPKAYFWHNVHNDQWKFPNKQNQMAKNSESIISGRKNITRHFIWRKQERMSAGVCNCFAEHPIFVWWWMPILFNSRPHALFFYQRETSVMWSSQNFLLYNWTIMKMIKKKILN